MDFAAARKVMVDSQVRVNDVTDRGLQAALLGVVRERFCAADRAFACYGEVEVEIAGDRRLMQAREVAKLLQALDARPGQTALAIAAPYAAAVLAALGLTVTAQESDAAVADVVRPALEEAGVTLELAPLTQPTGADWDVIISEGAVAVRPTAWLERLRIGGRLAVVERSGPNGRAVLYVRGQEGFSRRELFDAAPPVLAEMTPAPAFAL
ncbi:protein-L-isoaspartate O-methyltransferase [Brevundimonas sp. LM2]|uniref:protein-L-isoaspartate O-methyltransferase family protein n=1 Tax=Brevundimonas sp. LM2 TaxID=1938605 RepID=UPI00098401AD|nr:protein-L-isoaspartate O-methyltransferase [Brevundimonas sp. LM2]AQR62049.1 protein-L-isoaspartate O-methyltransferase [Brevundimonas sp. LM2]